MPSSEPHMSTDSIGPERFSIMYTILPPIVQSRIPKLPSIRQAVGRLRRSSSYASSISDSTRTRTPPPRYSSRPASAGENRWSMISDSEATDISHNEEINFDHSPSSRSTPPTFLMSEDQSGINWKYANQGRSRSNPP